MSDGHREVFGRLFAESREALRRYVRRLIGPGGTADDIVQEAFLRTYQQRDSVQTPRAFLFSTARNLVWDNRRRERIAATESVGDFDNLKLPDSGEPLESLMISEEASRLLKEAIERLPPQCRLAFTLKVFHGCSYKEIGSRLSLSEKTVEKHIALGLQRTHSYLRSRYGQRRGLRGAEVSPAREAHREEDTKHG